MEQAQSTAPWQTNVDQLTVVVYPDRAMMGAAVGAAVAQTIRTILSTQPTARIVFAAAPSQNEFLATLCTAPDIAWARVTAFQMDEYLDLPVNAQQRFSTYLHQHLFDHVHPGTVNALATAQIASTDQAAIAAECARYADLLSAAPIDIVCLGIGENGHLAFNDPPVADFHDPAIIKPVALDNACRQQQVNDGAFPTFAAVPARAITLTIPTLLSGKHLFCTVPGPAKREAIRQTLWGPIATSCPGSILRTHPHCTLYTDSAGLPDQQPPR